MKYKILNMFFVMYSEKNSFYYTQINIISQEDLRLMDSLLVAFFTLMGIVLIIAIYGYLKGGVEGMLEKEINHNTIEADQRLEITRYIDFFKQVKRVDSIYINQSKKTIQIKKNNRLSEPFYLDDLNQFNVEFNGTILQKNSRSPWFFWNKDLEPEAVEQGDWAISFSLKTGEYLILFESYEIFKKVVESLQAIEESW